MHSGVMHKHNIHMSTPVIDTLVMYAYMEHLVSHIRMFSYVSVYYSFKVQKGTLWGSVFSTPGVWCVLRNNKVIRVMKGSMG